MADDLGLAQFSGMFAGMGSTIYMIMMVVFALAVLFGVIFFIWWWTSYKIFFRVRELTGDKTRIIDCKAKIIKTKEGIRKWKIRLGDFVPIPSKEAIHLTKKGKLSVEAYYTPEHEYKYIDDKGKEVIKKQEKTYSYLIDNGITAISIDGFKALNTQDREFYAGEMKTAEEYKKRSIMDYIFQFAGMAMVIIILILVFVFWEDITKPVIEAGKANVEVTKQQTELTKQMAELVRLWRGMPDTTPPNMTIQMPQVIS